MGSVYSDDAPAHVDGLEVERRPSSSDRWFRCPGSVWVSAVLPPLPTSVPAEVGTAAHWVFERVGNGSEPKIGTQTPNGIHVDTYMVSNAVAGVKTLRDTLGYMMGDSCTVSYEQGVKYASPEGDVIEGTADVVAYSDDVLAVVDYKYGLKYVSEKGNTQILIYCLAARRKVGRRGRYYTGILQPRVGDHPGAIRWDVMTDERLDTFEVNLNAAIARTKMFPANYCTGSHCYFCPGKTVCPAVCSDFISSLVARKKPLNNPYSDPINLWALEHAATLKMLMEKIKTEAEEFIKAGGRIHGFTGKKSFGNRRWKQDVRSALIEGAEKIGLSREAVEKEAEKPIIGIVEAEKLGIDTTEMTDRYLKFKLVKVEEADSLKGF